VTHTLYCNYFPPCDPSSRSSFTICRIIGPNLEVCITYILLHWEISYLSRNSGICRSMRVPAIQCVTRKQVYSAYNACTKVPIAPHTNLSGMLWKSSDTSRTISNPNLHAFSVLKRIPVRVFSGRRACISTSTSCSFARVMRASFHCPSLPTTLLSALRVLCLRMTVNMSALVLICCSRACVPRLITQYPSMSESCYAGNVSLCMYTGAVEMTLHAYPIAVPYLPRRPSRNASPLLHLNIYSAQDHSR
jgi:hypothetical protein